MREQFNGISLLLARDEKKRGTKDRKGRKKKGEERHYAKLPTPPEEKTKGKKTKTKRRKRKEKKKEGGGKGRTISFNPIPQRSKKKKRVGEEKEGGWEGEGKRGEKGESEICLLIFLNYNKASPLTEAGRREKEEGKKGECKKKKGKKKKKRDGFARSCSAQRKAKGGLKKEDGGENKGEKEKGGEGAFDEVTLSLHRLGIHNAKKPGKEGKKEEKKGKKGREYLREKDKKGKGRTAKCSALVSSYLSNFPGSTTSPKKKKKNRGEKVKRGKGRRKGERRYSQKKRILLETIYIIHLASQSRLRGREQGGRYEIWEGKKGGGGKWVDHEYLLLYHSLSDLPEQVLHRGKGGKGTEGGQKKEEKKERICLSIFYLSHIFLLH